MREILFKGKTEDGEWVEGSLFVYNKDNCLIITKEDADWSYVSSGVYDGSITEVQKDTICQYTGLTDKNGNKIWENDILIYDNSPYNVYCTPHKGEIVCRNGCLCFKYWLYGSTNYMPFTADVFFDKKSEVIGNIFDNPELLKGE